MRQETAQVRQALVHLEGGRFREPATFFEPAMCKLVHLMATGVISSWSCLKPLSNLGYDTRRNGMMIVDYGNFQYKVVLRCLCSYSPTFHELLCKAAEYFPTLEPDYNDTSDSLEHQGDILEIFLALSRGNDFHDLYSLHPVASWRSLYTSLCTVCAAVDLLYSVCTSKPYAKNGSFVTRCPLLVVASATMLTSTSVFSKCLTGL